MTAEVILYEAIILLNYQDLSIPAIFRGVAVLHKCAPSKYPGYGD